MNPGGMGKFDISDPDPNNWTAEPNITWAGMQYNSNSIIVDDVIYALDSAGFLLFDTAYRHGRQVAFSSAPGRITTRHLFADGKLWSVSSTTTCTATTLLPVRCAITWTNGKSTDQLTQRALSALVSFMRLLSTATPTAALVVSVPANKLRHCAWLPECCDELARPESVGQRTSLVNPFEQCSVGQPELARTATLWFLASIN